MRGSMKIKKVDLIDNLRLNIGHVAPHFLRGIFIHSRFLYSLLLQLGLNPYSHAFAAHLVRKYGTKRLMANMAGRKTLLLLDNEDVQHVLAHSPDIYAENELKRRGMSHFQPHSVTVSHGDEWTHRRAFNEKVLESTSPVHHLSSNFALFINRTVQQAEIRNWRDITTLFDQIMLLVVFGDHQTHQMLSDELQVLMRQANRVFLLRASKRQARLAGSISALLREQNGNGLVGTVGLPINNHYLHAENQVPHWMFAISDTLAINTAQALALITAHPDIHTRTLESLADRDLTNPHQIAELTYLEGCLQEAMRLWPTTPILTRKSIRQDNLDSQIVSPGTQVVIFNQYLHREAESVPDCDAFQPDRWASQRTNPQFNHLSNGRQVCAGKNLALFLGTAVLANLILRRYALMSPRIDPGLPVPPTFNYFRLRFTTLDRSSNIRPPTGS